MNKNFKNFAKIILILAIAIAAFALSSCNGKEPDMVSMEREHGQYQIEIYPFKYKGHDYLYFETHGGTPMGVTENPECKKCKIK